MGIHSTTCDEKVWLYTSSQCHQRHCSCSLSREYPLHRVLYRGGPLVPCHGPECSRSRRVTGSYGRSTGIGVLVDTSREHGHSAVSMETMDSYRLTCKGGPSTATRRTKLKEQAQPRRGPSSRSMQMVTTHGLERQESKASTPGHEEEEQCRRSRHHSRGTGVPSRRGP